MGFGISIVNLGYSLVLGTWWGVIVDVTAVGEGILDWPWPRIHMGFTLEPRAPWLAVDSTIMHTYVIATYEGTRLN